MSATRSATIAFAVAVALGLLGLLLAGLTQKRALVDSIGVHVTERVVTLVQNSEACQGPLEVEADRVNMVFNTVGKPGPALEVAYRAQPGGPAYRTARVPAGYRDGGRTVVLGEPPEDDLVYVCVRNLDPGLVEVYGTLPLPRYDMTVLGAQAGKYTHDVSELRVDGNEVPGDAFIDFPARQPRSLLAAMPQAVSNAAAWVPGPVATPFVALLLLLCLVGGVGALGVALRRAAAEDEPPASE